MRATIAHYRIIEKLGEGGMGEVWKAQDTQLDRLVAIKILASGKLTDSDRKRRFIQEAKAASALNYPNIITIYEIGSDDGVDYIAMEYVAGRTLHQAIGRQGVPLKQAIAWSIQIAGALARAHAKGIVHRDIKPGNIMINDDSAVKVLDFGLSKLMAPEAGDEHGDTITLAGAPRTEEGKLIGTVAYMSPEQAEGHPIDARSDIFSFGALLYELVTGRRAFTGDSKISILAGILREDPAPASSIVSDIPDDLERIIARCLRKDPGRRYQHMDDVRIALEDLKEESESGVRRRVVPIKPRPRWPWIAATAAGAAALVVAAILLWPKRPQNPGSGPALTRLTDDSGLTTDAALSPDGRLLAYASDRAGDGGLDIWVKQLAGGEPVRITQLPEDEHEPGFSPDGTHIAYRSEAAGGGLYEISSLGGQPRLIVSSGHEPRYSPDGKLIAFWKGNPTSGTPYNTGSASVWVVGVDGGEPRRVDTLSVAARPEWTADGKHLLFAGRDEKTRDLWAASLDGGRLLKTGAVDLMNEQHLRFEERYPQFVRGPGDRYYVAARLIDSVNLWSINLAPGTWKADGLTHLTFGTESEIGPAISGDRMVFTAAAHTFQVWSVRLDANRGVVQGAPERLTQGGGSITPELSRDGNKMLYMGMVRGRERRALVRDLTSGADTVVATARIHHPTISKDGAQIAYRDLSVEPAVSMVVSGSGGAPQKLCTDCGMLLSWTNDGRQIFFKKNKAIALLDASGGKQSILLQHPTYDLWQAEMSPDGRWVAFLGSNHIYVAPFRPGLKPSDWITVVTGKEETDKPRWSPNGQLIYFTSMRDGSRCIWAQRLIPATKAPDGEPFAVMHFHSSVRSLSSVDMYSEEISVVPGRMVFVLDERRGNLWMTQAR